jgi:hypothetical protein
LVHFRSNLERRQPCESTPNWLKNSNTIHTSRRFSAIDMCPNTFTTPGTNYEVAGLQPDESTCEFTFFYLFFNSNF